MKPIAWMILLAILSGASCSGADANRPEESSVARSDFADMEDLRASDSVAYRRWGHPQSPHRDDKKYLEFLDGLLAIDTLPEDLRLRAAERRRVVLLNRPGSIANDFGYIERHGAQGSLHALVGSRIVLVFYDPECPHCRPILESIANSKRMNRAIEMGELTVLAVYAEGKRDVWERTKADMPANWLVGYDTTGILDRDLYALPAMPTIYLLDTEHRVVLKDPTIPMLTRHLNLPDR